MGKSREKKKELDYSSVIGVIEHWLQHGTSVHPHASHEQAAQEMESGDAWRAMVELGRELDKIKACREVESLLK